MSKRLIKLGILFILPVIAYAQVSDTDPITQIYEWSAGQQLATNVIGSEVVAKSDGSNGAFAVFTRSGANQSIQARRINSDSSFTPAQAATVIDVNAVDRNPDFDTDKIFSSILVTAESLNSVTGKTEIFANRFNSGLTSSMWGVGSNGIKIISSSNASYKDPLIRAADQDSVILCLEQTTGVPTVLKGVVVKNSDGTLTKTLTTVISDSDGITEVEIAVDDEINSQIIYIAWKDQNSEIRITAINFSLQIQSGFNGTSGVVVSNNGSSHKIATASTDCYLTCIENGEIVVKRVRVSGGIDFSVNVTNDGLTHNNPSIAVDVDGSALVVFESGTGTSTDLYMQKVDSSGTLIWDEGTSVAIATVSGAQRNPQMFIQDFRIIVLWEDYNASTGSSKLYGQQLNDVGSTIEPACVATGTLISNTFGRPYLAPNFDDNLIVWSNSSSIFCAIYTNECAVSRPNAPIITGSYSTSILGGVINITINSTIATSTEIYRSGDGGGHYTLLDTVPAGTSVLQDPNLQPPGSTFFYRARNLAIDSNGITSSSLDSNVVSVTVPITSLDAPTYLASSAYTDPTNGQGVMCTWQDNSIGETGFFVEKSINNGPYAQVAQAGSNGYFAFVSGQITAGTSFRFRIRSHYNNSVFSGYSNEVEVTSLGSSDPLTAPIDLQKSVIQNNATLTWIDTSLVENGFEIERTSSSGTTLITVAANSSSYINTGLSIGIYYTYRIRSYRVISGNTVFSTYSNTVSFYIPSNFLVAPTNLQVTLGAGQPVSRIITFDDNSTNEMGFKLERKFLTEVQGWFGPTTQWTDWIVITELPAHAETGQVSHIEVLPYLSNVIQITYRVRAWAPYLGMSDYTNEATVSVSPGSGSMPGPGNFTATAISDTQIKLTWSYGSNPTNFTIERSFIGGQFQLLSEVPGTAREYIDSGLQPGTTYSYRIKACTIFLVFVSCTLYSGPVSATAAGGSSLSGNPPAPPTGPVFIPDPVNNNNNSSTVNPNQSQSSGKGSSKKGCSSSVMPFRGNHSALIILTIAMASLLGFTAVITNRS
ncbi:MAG: fibronectin type III domain-containing protein [Planctomycetes bacterium]|nr:fibronectin type III domain-containing protein [Planctomycetota bacterium]